jgi:hypothetical protein
MAADDSLTTFEADEDWRAHLVEQVAFWTGRAGTAGLHQGIRRGAATTAEATTAVLADVDAGTYLTTDAGVTPEPEWCEIKHRPGWPVHSARIGEVLSHDQAGPAQTTVELNDFGIGYGPGVSVHIFAGRDVAAAEFTADQARALASLLIAAAAVLDSQQHPLSEPTTAP